ncbi:hypothetical protein J2N86_14965 (plasmid) [Legionella lytica]|uniref:BNR/Asp-box repeat containing protein n=1 Tax=Legionella lytica TaxID=96232 RepID=A0ABY4YCU3_9GAMM|nr:sialidase family protein [Legionella lytica]USQ15261.1 hypothetical protein J2N86_14965 [Legionella lytica]
MRGKKGYFCKRSILTVFTSCLMLSNVQAGTPLWTLTPQTPTDITVIKGKTEQVIYTVHNQSSKPKTLLMKSINGITQNGPCHLTPKGTCTLSLDINGSVITGDVFGGPVLCQQGNLNQCYQPSAKDSLHIKLTQKSPVTLYTAFGLYSSSDGLSYPMLAQSTDGGSHWFYKLDSATTSPMEFIDEPIIASTSCSESICVAVGDSIADNIIYPMLVQSTDGGSNWSYKLNNTSTLPTNFSDYGQFFGSSCSGSMCTAAGGYLSTDGAIYPLLTQSIDGGSHWFYKLDSTSAPTNHTFGGFYSTSCSGSICTAVGAYTATDGSTYSLLAQSTDGGAHWSYKLDSTAVLPTAFSNNGQFVSTSCSGSTCTAVGSYRATDGNTYSMLAQSTDGGALWSYKLDSATVLPTGFSNNGQFASASCSGSTCTAVGSYRATDGKTYSMLAQSTDGGAHWSYKLDSATVLPTGFSNNGQFASTSCSGSTCTAVGSYRATDGNTYSMLAQSTDGGTHWSYKLDSATVLPMGFSNNGQFASTNCSGSTYTAVGSYTATDGSTYPMLAQSTDGGNHWSYKLDNATTLPGDFNGTGTFLSTASSK